MTDKTNLDSDIKNSHQTTSLPDAAEVDRLIDEAAMRFARLFLDQCMHAKQPEEHDGSL